MFGWQRLKVYLFYVNKRRHAALIKSSHVLSHVQIFQDEMHLKKTQRPPHPDQIFTRGMYCQTRASKGSKAED